MRRYWELARTKIDAMSLRERAMIFVAAAFVLISLMNVLLLDPLSAKQKILSAQLIQQQEKVKELQAKMQSLVQAKREDERSPLRDRLAQLKKKLKEQDGYLQSRSGSLIKPNKMAGLLKDVLNKNGSLQLVALKTLPVGSLIDKSQEENGIDQSGTTGNANDGQMQIYKHGVQITVRGGYLRLLRYVSALESLPVKMFWGEASLSVDEYPDSVLTLTLYTLSMDKIWLTV